MGTAMAFDPVAEHERTRAALAAATPRLVQLLRDAPNLDAASGVPMWTVGDVGTHLAAVYMAYGAAASPDDTLDWESILPPGDMPFVERITAMNAQSLNLFDGAQRPHLGDFITERGEQFLRDTKDLAPNTPIAAPWYGKDSTLTLSTVTGLMLSETLVHGLDIARGARLPWPIGPDEARLVIGQSMPTMMQLALDKARSKGVTLAFDLAIKGGLRLAVVVDDGTMTVTRDAPPRTYDCRITAAPTAFLLVAFRRTPIWKAIARGQLRAGGRRPWLATRFGELITTP